MVYSIMRYNEKNKTYKVIEFDKEFIWIKTGEKGKKTGNLITFKLSKEEIAYLKEYLQFVVNAYALYNYNKYGDVKHEEN